MTCDCMLQNKYDKISLKVFKNINIRIYVCVCMMKNKIFFNIIINSVYIQILQVYIFYIYNFAIN